MAFILTAIVFTSIVEVAGIRTTIISDRFLIFKCIYRYQVVWGSNCSVVDDTNAPIPANPLLYNLIELWICCQFFKKVGA